MRKHRSVVGVALEVDALSQLAKVLWTVDGDGSETEQKDRADDGNVRAGRGGERACREARVVRELGRGEDRTMAV